MNSLPSSIPSQHYIGSINTGQPLAASSSQTRHPHPAALSLASLSPNAQLALHQTEAQLNGYHQLMALLAHNGIADGAMHLSSTQGADAHYKQQVNVLPENDIAHLTVRARLNGQAQYDIAGIDLHVPSSDRTESIALFASPPAAQHHEAPSVSSYLAAQYSRGQLAQAMIRQINPLYSSPPPPSGASVSTQSMVFSQDGSAGASSSRGRNAQVDDPLRPGETISRALRSSRKLVPDPLHSGQTISRGLLSSRKLVPDPLRPGKSISQGLRSKRQLVPDPLRPGETISRGLLSQQKLVDDPVHPGQTISQSLRSSRKLVPDPLHSGQTISQSLQSNRQLVDDPLRPGQKISRGLRNSQQLVDDPLRPGQKISRGLRNSQKLVDDPLHPGQTISRALLRGRQPVDDPLHPGQTISQAQLDKRNSRVRAAAKAAKAAEAENA